MSDRGRLAELVAGMIGLPFELTDLELWRLSLDFERPVLRRLPRLELERRDKSSYALEPDPVDPEVRAALEDEPDTGTDPHAAEWWKSAYHGGGPAKVKGFPRPLYPPDVPPSSGYEPSSSGPDVEAYKRTVSRCGRWPWQQFDCGYWNTFAHGSSGNVGDSGVAGFQRQQGIPASGWLGKQTFENLRYALVPVAPGFVHGGEQAMDAVARNLIDEAWQMFNKPPAGVDDVREAIADFCRRSIDAAPEWSYLQQRAMQYLGVSPDAYHASDCSEHATEAYYWARKVTGVAVPDPNKSGYNGYGYTGTLVDNPTAGAPFKVGDLAIYGQSTGTTEHVCTCYQAGDSGSSEWCSHGSEAAPYAVELHYRGDLLCVVRPQLVP